jgi:hypothetical protein
MLHLGLMINVCRVATLPVRRADVAQRMNWDHRSSQFEMAAESHWRGVDGRKLVQWLLYFAYWGLRVSI